MPGTAARRTATGTRRTTGTTTSAFGLPELRRWSGCFARRNRPLFPFRCRRCVADKSLPCDGPVLVASAKVLDGPLLRKRWALRKTCSSSRSRAAALRPRPLTTGPGATSHPPIPGRSDRPSPAGLTTDGGQWPLAACGEMGGFRPAGVDPGRTRVAIALRRRHRPGHHQQRPGLRRYRRRRGSRRRRPSPADPAGGAARAPSRIGRCCRRFSICPVRTNCRPAACKLPWAPDRDFAVGEFARNLRQPGADAAGGVGQVVAVPSRRRPRGADPAVEGPGGRPPRLAAGSQHATT